MTNKKEIYKYSNPEKVLRNAIDYLGDNVILDFSSRSSKKYMIYNPNNKKWVHFGAMGYEDYTKHKNETRRNNYIKRASKIKGNWKSNKYSPNNLSINILW